MKGTRFRKAQIDDIHILAEMVREMAAFLDMSDVVAGVGEGFEAHRRISIDFSNAQFRERR